MILIANMGHNTLVSYPSHQSGPSASCAFQEEIHGRSLSRYRQDDCNMYRNWTVLSYDRQHHLQVEEWLNAVNGGDIKMWHNFLAGMGTKKRYWSHTIFAAATKRTRIRYTQITAPRLFIPSHADFRRPRSTLMWSQVADGKLSKDLLCSCLSQPAHKIWIRRWRSHLCPLIYSEYEFK